ncbi:MAG: tetratricopeptide repeat protein [Calditrichaceae bacterium]|nr:tetratricopeptide repeat protein [Calditrichia bacterium]NUQ42944.1 tetratricopeptide repeat protein [Calditrichaceae bacterium]
MPRMLDFHLEPQGEAHRYTVKVYPRGDSQLLAQDDFEFPVSFLTGFEISRMDAEGGDPRERLERLTAFGQKLYQKLFTPPIKAAWEAAAAGDDFLTLCLRVSPDPACAGLQALPWETLHDGQEFIAAGARSGLSRLPLDIDPRPPAPPLPPPLKMLALVSSPLDLKETERLQIEREQEILLQAVNSPAGQGAIALEFEDEAKLPILETALENHYHILHYSGHGISPENGGGLLLEDLHGNRRPATVEELLSAIRKSGDSLKLVALSGCQTARTLHSGGFRDLARGLARQGVPAVIAMQFSISDDAGLLFAEQFYLRVAAGLPLEQALSATRRQMLYSDKPHLQADALAAVLIAADGNCLKVEAKAEAEAKEGGLKIDFSFHLPLAQLSRGFYGRRKEYREIRDALVFRGDRAVIVHGIGGIGKTALISYSAERLRKHFKGVYAFNCSVGALAPERILLELHRYFERLGVNELQALLHQSFPPEQLATYLAQFLSQWPLLLIFDNFESQLTPAPVRPPDKDVRIPANLSGLNRPGLTGSTHSIAEVNLREFMAALVKATATGTRFLFTTRYRFDLESKRVGNIRELPLHDLSRPEALGLMQKLPRLSGADFPEKLRAFKTFGGHPYALVALDRHCAHQPLTKALENAAGLHGELREFLVLELNYSQLSERARELLDRLSAFRVPVAPGAAEWVMGEKVNTNAAVELLKRIDREKLPEQFKNLDDAKLLELLEKSLPQQRKAENLTQPIKELADWGLLTPILEAGSLAQLAVHSLVRDFCRERHNREAWRLLLRDAAAFYTNQTKLIRRDDKSPAALWSEMEAFELRMEAGDWEDAANLLMNAGPLLDRWGWGRYLESQYNRLLDKAGKPTLAKILHNRAILLQNRGDYGAALEHYRQSLEIEEELGNRAGVAITLHQIGMIHQQRGEYGAALEQYRQSLAIKEEIGDRAGVAKTLHQIGMIHQDRGDYGAALEQYRQSLEIVEEIGDRAGVAKTLHQIGMIHQARGDYGAALEQYRQSLEIEEELGNRAGVAQSLHQIGMIHQDRGEYGAALEQYRQSLEIVEEIGDRAGVAQTLHQIGMIHQQRGEYGAALEHYRQSLEIEEELGNRAGVAESRAQIGKLFTETARYPEALEHLFFALAELAQMQSPNAQIVANMLKTLRGKWGAAHFDPAWQKATGQPAPDWVK